MGEYNDLKMYKFLVLSFFALFGGSVSQIYQEGQCDPNISLEAGFLISNVSSDKSEFINEITLTCSFRFLIFRFMVHSRF